MAANGSETVAEAINGQTDQLNERSPLETAEKVLKTEAQQRERDIDRADDPPESVEQRLSEGARRIVQIILPVTFCAIYCSLLVRIISWHLTPSGPNLLDSTWTQLGLKFPGSSGGGQTNSTGISSYLLIVGVFCLLIILTTLLMLFIFYMRWQQYLVYYFYLPPAIVLFCLTPAFLRTALEALNLFAIDIYLALLITWNFGAFGMMSIFNLWLRAPLEVQQFYLMHNSVMLAILIILALSGWAPWLLLVFLTLWDLFAVLSPIGPLNLLLSLAEREGVIEVPGLVYSTNQTNNSENERPGEGRGAPSSERSVKTKEPLAAKGQKTKGSESKESAKLANNDAKQLERSEVGVKQKSGDIAADVAESDTIVDGGVCMGLGDFIIYSLLIGLTSKGRELRDFHALLSALSAIQFGLILTLSILAFRQRPLPALPISIGLGLLTAGLTMWFVVPFANRLSSAAIFI